MKTRKVKRQYDILEQLKNAPLQGVSFKWTFLETASDLKD